MHQSIRVLRSDEITRVAGGADTGNSLLDKGLSLCEGMADSKTVTLTQENSIGGSIGVASAAQTEKLSFTLTCGDLRTAAATKP